MGTSTCHVMNGTGLSEVPGMCGVVDGGIVPGLWGYEAGQSGVGDIFAWFTDHAVPPEYHDRAAREGISIHELLSREAATQHPGAHGLIALDWESGNRSVLVDHHLSGLIVGLTLATTAPEIYRALIEATAFGTRVIIDTFNASGVPVTELVIAGGLIRNKTLMQLYADVTRMPLSIIGSEQGPALGSALHAAVAAGAYQDIQAAGRAMGRKHEAVYVPDPANAQVYDQLYREYCLLHDYFGKGGNAVMHRLRAIRDRALSGGGPRAPGRRLARPAGRPGVLTGGARHDHHRRERAAVRQARDEVCTCTPSWSRRAGRLDLGQHLRPGARRRPHGDQAERDRVPGPDPGLDGRLRPGRHPGRGHAEPVQRYRRARLRLPAPARGRRRGAHPFGYATAWAARGEAIPCVLTAMADEFGGEIPLGPFALIGGDDIGRGIVETLSGHRSPAVLMRSHGVFTIGATARDASRPP